MSIEQDFAPQVAAQMQAELTRFVGKCHYDETKKKIVYHDDRSAMFAYMSLQREEMERHKWLESEKARRDLGGQSLNDWVCKHSTKFRSYWRKTHIFVQPGNHTQDADLNKTGS